MSLEKRQPLGYVARLTFISPSITTSISTPPLVMCESGESRDLLVPRLDDAMGASSSWLIHRWSAPRQPRIQGEFPPPAGRTPLPVSIRDMFEPLPNSDVLVLSGLSTTLSPSRGAPGEAQGWDDP